MSPQARYWLLTIPFERWNPPSETDMPELYPACTWIKGQQEIGEGGYRHWQVISGFSKKVRLNYVKRLFGSTCHAEPTRSAAAEEYVHKEETSIPQSRFDLGKKVMKRNNADDWDKIWNDAQTGNLMEIPADVRIRSYHTLKRIRKDFEEAPFREGIRVNVFYGVTGSGKSHRMHQEAYADEHKPFIKSSTTKWWDGYKGETRVIIDEFRGQIAVEHLLKWFDKYPCFVEEKGGQLALKATQFWVCSNLSPDEWFHNIDEATKAALKRRLTITHFCDPFNVLINRRT